MWHTTAIDSREVPITNKKRIAQLIGIYGDDSDYVRIRILGQISRAKSLMEFFLVSDIDGATSPREQRCGGINEDLAIGGHRAIDVGDEEESIRPWRGNWPRMRMRT